MPYCDCMNNPSITIVEHSYSETYILYNVKDHLSTVMVLCISCMACNSLSVTARMHRQRSFAARWLYHDLFVCSFYVFFVITCESWRLGAECCICILSKGLGHFISIFIIIFVINLLGEGNYIPKHLFKICRNMVHVVKIIFILYWTLKFHHSCTEIDFTLPF